MPSLPAMVLSEMAHPTVIKFLKAILTLGWIVITCPSVKVTTSHINMSHSTQNESIINSTSPYQILKGSYSIIT